MSSLQLEYLKEKLEQEQILAPMPLPPAKPAGTVHAVRGPQERAA